MYYERDDLSGAITAARKAIELKPHIAEALVTLGAVLADQGHLEEASIRLKRAIELKPDSAMAHNDLGTVYIQQS